VDQVASICKSIASERVSGSFFVCFSFCFGLFHSVCHVWVCVCVCLCVSACVCVNMKDVWEIPAECQVKSNIGSDLLHCVTSASSVFFFPSKFRSQLFYFRSISNSNWIDWVVHSKKRNTRIRWTLQQDVGKKALFFFFTLFMFSFSTWKNA